MLNPTLATDQHLKSAKCEGIYMDTEKSETQQSLNELMRPHSEITAKLKQLYSSIQAEPLPENIINLLDQLDAAEENDSHSKEKL